MPVETIAFPIGFHTNYCAFYIENNTYIYSDMLTPALSHVRRVSEN